MSDVLFYAFSFRVSMQSESTGLGTPLKCSNNPTPFIGLTPMWPNGRKDYVASDWFVSPSVHHPFSRAAVSADVRPVSAANEIKDMVIAAESDNPPPHRQ